MNTSSIEPAPRTASCPNCGANVRLRWAQAVQTTCAYCRAVLVRHDLDLELVGKQAEFPETGSPIQIGTAGRWREQSFLVVGRLAYRWSRGRWNEWHCRLADGTSAWLSDAQLEYAMSVIVAPDYQLAPYTRMRVGDDLRWADERYTASTITKATYLGTEGELPFSSIDRATHVFIDLHNTSGGLATLDCSDTPPTLYVGEYCDFETLAMTNLRTFEGW